MRCKTHQLRYVLLRIEQENLLRHSGARKVTFTSSLQPGYIAAEHLGVRSASNADPSADDGGVYYRFVKPIELDNSRASVRFGERASENILNSPQIHSSKTRVCADVPENRLHGSFIWQTREREHTTFRSQRAQTNVPFSSPWDVFWLFLEMPAHSKLGSFKFRIYVVDSYKLTGLKTGPDDPPPITHK